MDEINYLDFDLHIDRFGDRYRVRVTNSPAGQAEDYFNLPFSELEVENFVLRVGRSRTGMRRLESGEMEAARKFGGGLFESIFSNEVRGRLRTSMNDARQKGAGLRFRMHLNDVPELAELPWEYLYDSHLDEFLVLSNQTPLVRYLDLPLTTRPIHVELPLKILVMISSPSDYPELDVEKEFANLTKGLGFLEQCGLVQLKRLEKASLIELQRQLRQETYHIFHFIGHGGFDEQAQDGVLLLEDASGRGRPVSGRYLGTLLHDQPTLRLAVLNACEGGRTSKSDPFSGVAHSLVQKGIPAVIAMQFEISDEAAIVLAREFYGAVADGYPVDASLAEARKAVFAESTDIEWGTPVLYMRLPDGKIFGLNRENRRALRQEQLERQGEALPAQGQAAELSQQPPQEAAAAQPQVQRGISAQSATSGEPAVPVYQGFAPQTAAAPQQQARRSVLPWLAAAIAVLALAATLLVAFGIVDINAITGAAGGQPQSAAVPIALQDTPTSQPSATATPEPTFTATLPAASEVPSEAAAAAVPAEPAQTATLEPSPSPTPTTGPTPIGSGSGQIAFASARSGRPQIWLINVDGSEAVQLTNRPDGACQPAWKPDGTMLAFTSPCSGNQEQYPNAALYIINADGTGERRITEGIGGDFDPAWSPDGSRIAFASDRADFLSIYVLDVESGGDPIALTRNSPNQQPAWSPDGSQFALVTLRYLSAPHIYTMPDKGEIAEDGDQARQFSRQEDYYYTYPKWSPDGRNLTFTKIPAAGGVPDLFGSKVSDKGLKEFPISALSGKGPMQEASYSPDGNWLVYEGWPQGGNHDIWIMTSNGTDLQQVTDDPVADFDAAWRP
ncbi:MAG TPA: CHAT domain-containing protein [Anaerolineales bacterium]